MPVRIPRIIPAPGTKNYSESENAIMKKIMDTLREADTNNDGRFNKEELKHALKDLGAFFPAWRTNRAFDRIDSNNDGEISGEEIDSLLEYLRSRGFGK